MVRGEDAVVRAILGYASAGLGAPETCDDLGLVLGWRIWRSSGEDDADLVSFVFDTPWPRRRALIADCPALSRTRRPPTRRSPVRSRRTAIELFGTNLHDDHEHAPAYACRCGIHAARIKADIPTTSTERRWIGAVALWGTVIEHKHGYRASHAYPLGLEEIPPSNALEFAEARTVLLVEDDEVVRRLGAELLERRSCRVLEARSDDEAIDILRADTVAIDLIVAPIQGCGIDGHGLIRRAGRWHPEIKVVANSGRFLVASLDGWTGPAASLQDAGSDRFSHPLARAYGVPVIPRR
jgi:CheY-like chemotaxis protein